MQIRNSNFGKKKLVTNGGGELKSVAKFMRNKSGAQKKETYYVTLTLLT